MTDPPVPADGDEVKLTVALGRGARAGGVPAHVALVAALRGTASPARACCSAWTGPPTGAGAAPASPVRTATCRCIVVSVGDAGRIAAAVAELDEALGEPPRTLERVRVCKRDGATLGAPHAGPGGWIRLTVVCGEQSRHAGRPLAEASSTRCARSGAAGATALRGVWGYHGDHEPHGDRLLQVRRRVPVVVTTVDTPERAAASYAEIDRLTATDGLVLSERVPAFLSSGPGVTLGGLDLARAPAAGGRARRAPTGARPRTSGPDRAPRGRPARRAAGRPRRRPR